MKKELEVDDNDGERKKIERKRWRKIDTINGKEDNYYDYCDSI